MRVDKEITNDSLKSLPEDVVLFEIKQYFLSCRKCREIITDDEVIERCDMCNNVWCCVTNNTSKRYFETTLNLCVNCVKKVVPEQPQRKRRENIKLYNFI